jgi:plasmid stabilization system protein ParE
MDRRVSWTESALADVELAAGYIARAGSTRAAARLVLDAKRAARSLREMPNRGRRVPELLIDDNYDWVREIQVPPYRMLYHVTSTDVYIVAFIHSARDFAELDLPKRVEWLIHDRPRSQ